jgi:acyl-CoA synthetase (AMP-forming)/AMP-acid ligase II
VTDWNFADVWETVADLIPKANALAHEDRRVTWAELDRRADGIAQALIDAGLGQQDKVAQYLRNCPEYLESTFGSLKAGFVPVNTNYRYGDEELYYLWDNADAACIIVHGSFVERADKLRSRLTKVRFWLWVDDGTEPCPDWATPYEKAASSAADRVRAPWGRSGDDLYLLYTGGTTGWPKGVMWRQDDLFARLNAGNIVRLDESAGLDGIKKIVKGPGPVHLPACPLMHGTGVFTSMGMLSVGGSVVTLGGARFDAAELLDAVDRDKVNIIAIVGDAFAKPIVEALDREPRRWHLSTLLGIVSSGVMWSEETKRALLRHKPTLLLVDAFSSSEAIGLGVSVSSGSDAQATAKFVLGPEVRVVDPDTLKDVVPGSGQSGVLALGGRNPLGYYKDTAKSESTFKEVDGTRMSIPGDFATVDSEGTIHLLGRGSVVINTGGEKVYPEEVEEVLKLHPAVRDAVVVGIPDARFGQAIVAAVELKPGETVSEEDLIARVKSHLSGFKAPRRIRFVDSIGRAPTGKVDYAKHAAEAVEWAAPSSGTAASSGAS